MINADDGDDLYEVPVRRALDRQYSPTEWIIADAPQSSQGFARGSEDEGPRSSIGLDVSGLRKRRRRALEEERGEDLSPTQMPASTTASAADNRSWRRRPFQESDLYSADDGTSDLSWVVEDVRHVSTVTHHHYPPSPISGPALIVHLAPVVLHGSRTERRVSVVLKRNIFVVALSLSAVLSGPLLVPFFLNTDPVTVLHARLDESESISGWYGPGAWVAYVLTVLAALAHILKLAWHVKTVHLWTWSSLACKDCPCVDKWDGDLLVAFVYTLFSVYDLIHRSVPVIHAHSMPYLELKNVPALQAAATSSYVGFGASYVLIIGFSMLLWSTWQGSFLDVMKAHRRRAIILGAMFVVAHVGVSICEHARLTFLARDTSVSPIFLPSRLTSGSVSVFGVVSDNLAPSAWIKILSIFYTLMGPAGALVIYGITVCIFLLLQSVRSSTITWRQAGATLIFAYVWPFCMFIVVMYLIILPVYFVIALWPSIWLAFTPGSGLFPCSNISVMELDQLGTLTTLVAAMAIRLFSYLNQVVKAHLVAHSDLETRSSSVSV